MTDEFTPEQEAAVRRLLAQERHDEPIPADVAARLEVTLAGLRPIEAGLSNVSDLAAARARRRNAGRLLFAAAAVVVAGVGVGQFVGQSADLSTADSAADGAAAEPPRSGDAPEANLSEDSVRADSGGTTAGTDASVPNPPADGDVEAGGVAVETPAEASTAYDDGLKNVPTPVEFTADRFLDQIEALWARPEVREAARAGDQDRGATGDHCAQAEYGHGLLLPATYDGETAVLAIRPDRDGSRLVEVLSCGTVFVLDSTSVTD